LIALLVFSVCSGSVGLCRRAGSLCGHAAGLRVRRGRYLSRVGEKRSLFSGVIQTEC
jgi:hypothetical protein